MKKLLFSLFAILAMVACSDDGIDQITIDTTSVNFATVGGSTSVTFASSGAWTAEVVNGGANAWCSVSPASGKAGNAEISITATANDTPDGRTATVVIKTGTVEKSIAVSQKQKDALDVSTSTFEFSAEGGEFKIEVGHNVEFDIEIDGDWITQMQPRALETSTLTFAVAENTTGQSREGSVTLTSKDGALSQVISVRQEAPRYEIIYTSSDGRIVTPYKTDAFGANIVSNTYENGRGVITFDRPITSIGDYAFKNCSGLTSITIPDGVTSIGDWAFESCTSLTSAIIPDGILSIGDDAFYYCTNLTSVVIPNSVTSIGVAAFNCCNSLTSVTIPDSVTSIGVAAFGGSSLTSFYGKFASADNRCLIVDGVLNSFAPAGLTTYTIPNGVTSIGISAFLANKSLTSITIPDSVTTIEYNAFNGCSNLNSVTIGNGVTTIGKRAFYYCRSLESVTIGNSVSAIEDYAFYQCNSLTSVNFPLGLDQIGDKAFYYCNSLISVTIPTSVASIGKEAFAYCSSLASVYCKSTTPPSLGAYGFNTNSFGRKIYVPTVSVSDYKAANNWSIYADSIEGYY